jgi:hypothetical protein
LISRRRRKNKVDNTHRGLRHDFSFDWGFDYRRRRRNLLWAIDKFATDSRLAKLLKLLVVLVCLGAILQRVLPLTY